MEMNNVVLFFIVILASVMFTLGLIYFIPRLDIKGKKIIKSLDTVLDGLEAIVEYFDNDKENESIYERILGIAMDIVEVAERLPNWNEDYKDLSKDELNKKQHEYVYKEVVLILSSQGIDITETVDKLINLAINVSVAIYTRHSE